MSEDLNKLRELAESLLEGQTGFADFAAFAQAQEEFQALTSPEETISLLTRLQAAEERAEKVEGALKYATGTLKALQPVLTVPAAEYVPAIPDAWAIIDDAIAEIENGR